MTEPRIHMRHALAIRRRGRRRLCLAGIEAWCRRHGIDLVEFNGPGVPGEQIAAIGDAYALKALAIARAEASEGGKRG